MSIHKTISQTLSSHSWSDESWRDGTTAAIITALHKAGFEIVRKSDVRETVDLEPGEYWLTSSGDGTGRAIVTTQRELLIEQKGGGWSCLGVGVYEGWRIEQRSLTDPTMSWAYADQWVVHMKHEADEDAKATNLANELKKHMSRETAIACARQLIKSGWRKE